MTDDKNNTQIEELIKNQNDLLTKINENLEDEEIEERKIKKIAAASAKIISFTLIGVGTLIGSWEFLLWGYEKWETRTAASQYAKIAKQLYFEENNASVAKSFLKKAIELDNAEIDYKYLDAYIDGMSSVRHLLNLDRPYNSAELNSAYAAFAKASLLEELKPNNSDSYILRAQIYTALKDYKRANNFINKAVKIDPNNDFAHVRRGVISYLSGDESTAIKSLNHAIKINNSSKWAYLWLGIINIENNEIKKATAHYDSAIKIDQRFDLAFYNKAWVFLKTRPKNYKAAEEHFLKALSLNPDYKEAFYGLGMVYGYQDKYEISEKYLSKAIELDPSYITALKWRGIVYDELNETKNSLKDFSSVLTIDPANLDVLIRRARVYNKNKNFNAALSDLLFVNEKDGGTKKVQYYIAQTYFSTGQFENSLNALDKSLSYDDKYSDAYLLKAQIYSKIKLKKNALNNFDSAINFSKYKKERYLFYKATYLKSIGMIQESISILRESISNNNKYIRSLLLMSEIYFELKNSRKTELYLDKVLSIEPENKEAKRLKGLLNE
jgi:tetratricopeptide (TPR) repeat protein